MVFDNLFAIHEHVFNIMCGATIDDISIDAIRQNRGYTGIRVEHYDIGLLSGIKGLELSGYEIHMGETALPETSHAFQVFETPQGATDYTDGALNADGQSNKTVSDLGFPSGL